MIRVKEVIVVEGKYDKIKLSSVVDGVIIETAGFGLFRDKERREMIRRMARKNGIVILTDSDGAGFLIRGKLSSLIPPEHIKNAYIPDIPGKERRKRAPSKEGTLGVEGMSEEILLEALARAGVTAQSVMPEEEKLTKADFYELGLSGGENSAQKRGRLLEKLGLPKKLSSTGLLNVARGMYGREEFLALVRRWEEEQTEEKTREEKES